MSNILTKETNYRPGDAVTATVINDTVKTALEAFKTASVSETTSQTALQQAKNAVTDSSAAKAQSEHAVTEASTAVQRSERAYLDMTAVSTCAVSALNKAESILLRASNGEFNGRDAVLTETAGMYGFQIINGDLILTYSGNTAPDLSIDAAGNLIYNY